MNEVVINEEATELITKKEVKDSPFTIISDNEKNEHFAAMGQYRITEVYDSSEAAEQEVVKVNWNRLIQVTMILIEANIK